jgi:predicted phage tail protein
MDEPIDETQLHLVPEFSGHGRGEGKMLLGLTLLGLSFVPGVQAGLTSGFSSIGESLAGASGAELGGMLGSRLLGGAGTWLMMAGASEALAPQLRQPAGDPSGIISGPQPTGEGAAVPLVYGRARVEAPPIISAGVTVRTMVP